MKFIEINTIEIKENNDFQNFNDLTVLEDHAYYANNYAVHNCSTSSNTALHAGMASLIADCADIKEANDLETKIIADGGISTYNRAITALALGADYVMIGSAFAKCYESAAPFIFYPNPKYPEYTNHSLDISSISKDLSNTTFNPYDYSLNADGTYTMFNIQMGHEFHRTLTPSENQKKVIIKNFKNHIAMKFFGMSTKEAQKLINKCARLKTSEGIVRIINVEYTLAQWVENFTDYLKSAMSYTGKRTLSDFIGNVEVAILSPGEQNAINK